MPHPLLSCPSCLTAAPSNTIGFSAGTRAPTNTPNCSHPPCSAWALLSIQGALSYQAGSPGSEPSPPVNAPQPGCWGVTPLHYTQTFLWKPAVLPSFPSCHGIMAHPAIHPTIPFTWYFYLVNRKTVSCQLQRWQWAAPHSVLRLSKNMLCLLFLESSYLSFHVAATACSSWWKTVWPCPVVNSKGKTVEQMCLFSVRSLHAASRLPCCTSAWEDHWATRAGSSPSYTTTRLKTQEKIPYREHLFKVPASSSCLY